MGHLCAAQPGDTVQGDRRVQRPVLLEEGEQAVVVEAGGKVLEALLKEPYTPEEGGSNTRLCPRPRSRRCSASRRPGSTNRRAVVGETACSAGGSKARRRLAKLRSRNLEGAAAPRVLGREQRTKLFAPLRGV
jgi:hypothetical protein